MLGICIDFIFFCFLQNLNKIELVGGLEKTHMFILIVGIHSRCELWGLWMVFVGECLWPNLLIVIPLANDNNDDDDFVAGICEY